MKDISMIRRHGEVVPFARSTDYWHRRAMDNRRSLRFPEAVELLRSAARLEPDNVEIQMDLAETLSEMECFEQSSRLLFKLLSRDPNLAECYYGLACNDYGLQKNEEALDALFNYLRLAPEGPYAEDARDMLEMLSADDAGPGGSRGELLIRRGMKAFADDRPGKAAEHLKRALKVSRDATRVRTMLSLALLSEGKPKEALRYAISACSGDFSSVQALCSLSCALWMLKKPKAAAGFLRMAAKQCDSPYEEQLFCHTASQLDQRELVLQFLQERIKWTPFRVGTLHSLAVANYNLGFVEKAKALWLRVIQIDPDNLLAEYGCVLCERAQADGGASVKTLTYHAALPKEENQRRLQAIASALSGGEEELRGLWHRDDSLKKTVRWAFSLPDARLQGALLGVLAAVGPEGASVVKELLTDDALPEELKRRAILLLNRMGEPTPYVLTYQRRIAQVDHIPQNAGGASRWRAFLKAFLMETGRWNGGREAASFASSLYRALPGSLRRETAGEQALQWVKAFELLYLYRKGRDQAVRSVVRELPISLRRIERVIRRIQKACPDAKLWEEDEA